MKFVILSNNVIPDYNGVRGPILTPTVFDLHFVLKCISYGIDIREVMPDGSYRKLQFNDERLMKGIDDELEEKRLKKEQKIEENKEIVVKTESVKAKIAKARQMAQEKAKTVVKEVKTEEKEEIKPSIVVDELEKPE